MQKALCHSFAITKEATEEGLFIIGGGAGWVGQDYTTSSGPCVYTRVIEQTEKSTKVNFSII